MTTTRSLDESAWLTGYFERYRASLFRGDVVPQLLTLKEWMLATHAQGKKVIIAGNGGSAAIASHCAVDFTKNAGVRCVNFNEADLITCLSNDYGYEQWMAKAVECYGDAGDVLIAISSSGQSKNVLNACKAARRTNFVSVVTFSGFDRANPLRQLGDENFWVDSRAYNLVELTHQFWLLALVDLLIGQTEYPATPTEATL